MSVGDASLLPSGDGHLYPSVSGTAHGATIAFSLQSMNAFPPNAGRFGSAIDSPIGIDTSHVLCVGFSQARFGSRRPGPTCAISSLLANSIASTAKRPSMQHLAPTLASIRHLHFPSGEVKSDEISLRNVGPSAIFYCMSVSLQLFKLMA